MSEDTCPSKPKITLLKENEKKFVNGIPYIDIKDNQLDYCLGSTEEEAGNVCRKLLEIKEGLFEGKKYVETAQ